MPLVLIVDDDASIRAMFARALRAIAECEQAAGGAEALELLMQKRYDLVLLDLNMGAIDGFAVLEQLGATPGPNASTPVGVITADGSNATRVQALREASFCLVKPVRIHLLQAMVSEQLRAHAPAPVSTMPPTPRT